jgi:ABC-type sugar transport system substrate-binding protein
VPFYANYKTGLEDGAKQFGFTYDLVDGNSGDVAAELANLQNFAAQKRDLIILTPSGEGIIPGIKQVNDAGIPIIEANNKAGFGRKEVNVLTYVGADDVEFGRLQGKLLDQAFGGKKAKIAYVMGFAGSPAQVLRAKGWDEFRAKNAQYEEVARATDDFDGAKALAVVQDLLSRFPKGQLDAIVMQGPEASAAVDFAIRNGRDEVKFIVGDYPADVRQLIYEGKIFGTVDQDPYPQAYNAMRMAWLHFNGKDADIPKPLFLPLPLVTKENAEKTPAAWGC